jgi:two-component system OmpR family response regulator
LSLMRLLLVEDDRKIANVVSRGLKEEGFVINHATDGSDGLHLAVTESYDAAIVDLMLPEMDGLTLIRELRRRQCNMPIIVLSAKREVEERVRCLHAGSDDYLVKPFAFSELLARVRALLRRAGSATTRPADAAQLVVGELVLNYVKHTAHRAGRPIELQPREFALLEYLMRNAGGVVSKTLILEHVWDYHFDPQTNVVDVLVCRLRRKLDRDFETPLLHTIRGVGYVLKTAP